MKTLKRIGLLAFTALSLTFVSCGDTEGSGTGIELDTFINAKVDGSDFKTFAVGNISAGTAVRSGNNVSVIGVAKTAHDATESRTITIVLANITEPGTYNISNTSIGSRLAYYDSVADTTWDTTDCEGAAGTVNVTTLSDAIIEGNFAFTGKDDDDCSSQKVITSGSFKGTF
jgi:hypothetical protein